MKNKRKPLGHMKLAKRHISKLSLPECNEISEWLAYRTIVLVDRLIGSVKGRL